ncbi:MAG: Tetratricopeptide (TPR) repeat [Chloroflexi bacterium AL-W]|nr:Tetratricopeptide (TPR) repeat [Chloroflexi bacterium AL-N1]NOK67254.1 Tetratricopeptide (TPR) repeat [Chloroflexi bacterium AL-N10]NOK75252.1 Tetratricopeptide (TPR) repeat [Chloroflexi bacterium AL-N5]NOK82040.1 Tetratricopeptide (TPR) repeat [Chloroflexi bacterium AL-W]NOK89885.1 Tetratricopeptide (TPR) repeat [Chloroflexi bacterium AL-N15]
MAYLAVSNQTHQRDRLVVLLWPAYNQTNDRAALRRALAMLNATPLSSWLVVDRETIGLQHSDDVWIDVAQFGHLLEKVSLRNTSDTTVSTDDVTSLSEAVALYRGDFMLGFTLWDSPEFDEWQFLRAEILRRDLGNALDRLVYSRRLLGDAQAAVNVDRRWVALDILNEEAHR